MYFKQGSILLYNYAYTWNPHQTNFYTFACVTELSCFWFWEY